MTDYQQVYCEKLSLNTDECPTSSTYQEPAPTYVDVCAREGDFRGAYCKKFAEPPDPKPAGWKPEYYEDCFFPNSEYKQIYCEELKEIGEWKPKCATDSEEGPNYCQAFASNPDEDVQAEAYIECHGWPGFMMLFCETKQNATHWDPGCANHEEVGANYCLNFATQHGIRDECVQYPTYMSLFCDTKASNNRTEKKCADEDHTAGTYCQQLAFKKNAYEDCWGVAQFDQTFCSQVTWTVEKCDQLAGVSSLDQGR